MKFLLDFIPWLHHLWSLANRSFRVALGPNVLRWLFRLFLLSLTYHMSYNFFYTYFIRMLLIWLTSHGAQWNLRQSNLIYPTMNTLMLSLLLELPNKSFWYDHKITDMPRLPDYLDVVFLSPMCEALTSGHCRKILLPTTSQNWWNVDRVAHKLRNLWSCAIGSTSFVWWLILQIVPKEFKKSHCVVVSLQPSDTRLLWPLTSIRPSFPVAGYLVQQRTVKCHGANLLYDCRSCCFL